MLLHRVGRRALATVAPAAAGKAAVPPNSRFTEYNSPTSWTIGHFPAPKEVKVHTTPNPFAREASARKKFTGDVSLKYALRPLLLTVQHNNLTFEEWTKLRKQLAAVGVDARVAQSRLVRARIMKEIPGADGARLGALFRGPIAIISAPEASPEKLKAITTLISAQPKLIVLGGRFEHRVVGAGELGPIAQLPTLDVLRGQLLGLIQSPAVSLTSLLQMAPIRVVATLEQAAKAKEEGKDKPE